MSRSLIIACAESLLPGNVTFTCKVLRIRTWTSLGSGALFCYHSALFYILLFDIGYTESCCRARTMLI